MEQPLESVSGKDGVVEMIMSLMGLCSRKDAKLLGHWRIIRIELWHQK